MTVFGDRAFRQVFRLNEVLRAEPQPKRTGVLIRKGRDTRDLAPPHTEQAVRGHGEKRGVCKPGRDHTGR